VRRRQPLRELRDRGRADDCHSGYVCTDANEDGTPECWPGGTGSATSGQPCEGVWECAGGDRARCIERPDADFPGGYCTLVGCTMGGTGAMGCPTGTRCSIASGETTGICLDACSGDGDCRTGYLCFDSSDVDTMNECLPAATGTGAVGTACRWREDCAGEEFGFCALFGNEEDPSDDQPGGYCVQTCEARSCPSGATCLGATGSRVCLDACATTPDCRTPDYTCQPDGVGGNVCATP
jgi:hypothetical protein